MLGGSAGRARPYKAEGLWNEITGDEPSGFDDEGVWWMGTRQELDAWKKYKRRKALAFVERGYSVSWYPDGDHWMEVYEPERLHARVPELRATIKFYGRPSRHGIDGGMVSKLSIMEQHADPLEGLLGSGRPRTTVYFNFDRGPDINRLGQSPRATALYHAVLEELN
jgi:hypothetical protein